ncbi:hypothetical protein [Streptomyces chrestomyceticus]|uniref:hypothetical protein n=1 Tax=Streptomyces chrestomyceticus TaxID=68185 RepID=UPI0033D8534B
MLFPDSVSDETLAQYAERLTDDYAAWPTWHTGNPLDGYDPTHVEMFTWRVGQAGWIGDKSNFEVARDLIRSAADEGCTGTEVPDEQVYECGGGSSAWDVAQLYVQVFEGGCEPGCPGTHADECRPGCDPSAERDSHVFDDRDRTHGRQTGLLVREGDFRCYECLDTSFYEREANAADADQRCTYCKRPVFLTSTVIAELETDAGLCFGKECAGDCHGTRTYTAAFRIAVALAEHIKHEYPFLDEDDYDQQRREEFEKNLDKAIEDVKLHYPYDSEADHKSIVEHGIEALCDLEYRDEDGHVDWGEVGMAYDHARDEHFLDLGRAFMRNEIPGQLALEVAGV